MEIKKYVAELIGSFVLILFGVGAIMTFAAGVPGNVGVLGIGLAFAIGVFAMVYAIGPISGCHINPAVTIGLLSIKAIGVKDAVMYIIFQLIGGLFAGVCIWLFYTDLGNTTGFVGGVFENASCYYNDFGNQMWTIFLLEMVLALVLQIVILGSLENKTWNTNAGLAIGFTVAALIYIAGPLDGAGINPLRSIVPAVFAEGGNAMDQLWVFVVSNILGAVIGSWIWKLMGKLK